VLRPRIRTVPEVHVLRFSRTLALAFLLALPSPALGQAALLGGFGGAADYGSSCLGPNDDGSSMEIDITPVFPTGVQFFNGVWTSMWVNTNGNVTFEGPEAAFTPAAFPVATNPMIAPYWADVDIRPANGTCGGYPNGTARPRESYAGDCQNPANNGVWWHLDTVNRRVIVTWDNVGYFRCHDNHVMNFQLILTAVEGTACGGGSDFDVEFRYNRCEWTTGDASGGQDGDPRQPADCTGTNNNVCPIGNLRCGGRPGERTCEPIPAQAGFDAGDMTNYVQIPGSRTAEVGDLLCTGSNVEMPGIWQFNIRSGVVQCPDANVECETGMPGACADGLMQCVGAGLECRQIVQSSDERCDSVDNDCNGMVDDAATCPFLQTCIDGVCRGACFEGGCDDGQVCNEAGECVDVGCETITCAESERCVDGACVAACDGVVCPHGQSCRAGSCVDLCAGSTCDECTACSEGSCIARCQIEACPAGQACTPLGLCIEEACATVTCLEGEFCQGGTCMDACTGAVCPDGQVCAGGQCVDAGSVDAGPIPPLPDAGRLNDGGPVTSADAGGLIGGPDAGMVEEETGCGCRAVGADRSPAALLVLGLVAIAIAVRRRR
jgi:MYXO-CTERM domain-containing protein